MLYNIKNDFNNDKIYFESQYEMTYEEFINYYGDDNEVIDLTGKVVISLTSFEPYGNTPVDLLGIFIPEGEKLGYKATLIYASHIAFIKTEHKNGLVQYRYKDDECCPQTYKDIEEYEDCPLTYDINGRGFKLEDMVTQIERYIQSRFDLNYKLNKDDLIILEGL